MAEILPITDEDGAKEERKGYPCDRKLLFGSVEEAGYLKLAALARVALYEAMGREPSFFDEFFPQPDGLRPLYMNGVLVKHCLGLLDDFVNVSHEYLDFDSGVDPQEVITNVALFAEEVALENEVFEGMLDVNYIQLVANEFRTNKSE